MSDETGLETKGKLNKKFLIGAVAVIAVVLVVTLAIFLPKSAEARKLSESLNLGAKYLSELNYEQAVVSYLAAIEIDPKNVDAYLGLADVYLAQGEYEKAVDVLEEALKELVEGTEGAESVKDKLEKAEALKTAAEAAKAPLLTNTPVPTSTPTPEPMATSTPAPTSTPTTMPTLTPTPIPTQTIETSVDDFTWAENEDGTLTITSFTNYDATSVVVPKEIEGKTVTVIGQAFYDCDSLISIVLPETITKIEAWAFQNCSALSEIHIPDSVIEIEYYAFEGCDSLKSIYIPANVEVFCGYTGEADQHGNDEAMPIVKEIIVAEENERFVSIDGSLYTKDKTTLLKVASGVSGRFTIPKSVKVVSAEAFLGCSAITEIVISGEETCISRIYGCSSLERFVIENNNRHHKVVEGVLLSETESLLICVPAKGCGTTYKIPNTVIYIDDEAFVDCTELEKVIIPASVNLASFCISINGYKYDGITSNPFYYCTALKEILVASDSEDYKSVDGVLYTKDGTTLVSMPCNNCQKDTYIVPEGVVTIGISAFHNCNKLVSITLPDSVEILGPYAFSNCSSLMEFNSNSLKTVGTYAFNNCTSLKSLVLPEGTKSIHWGTMLGCKNLETIVVPGSVSSIGEYAFNHCDNLSSVTIENGVETLGAGAFSYCDALTSITIPGSVIDIPKGAFRGSANVTIYTPAGSYAETYAIENGISYKSN